MVEKFAIGAQSAGFLSLGNPIFDVSTSGPTQHALNIPAGLVNIGGQGKGYAIPATNPFNFVPPVLTDGTYVIYVSPPTDSSGIAVINSDSFTTYINTGGDSASKRAICYFKVLNSILVADSIFTFHSETSIPTDDESPNLGFFFNDLAKELKKMGFFINKADHGFVFRGQYFDEEVSFDSAVSTGEIVYKNIDGKYHPAIATDTITERAVGVAEKDRSSIVGNNFVIMSGIVDIGTTILPNTTFPAGTYVYLSEITAGLMVRDFDAWVADNLYTLGTKIVETGAAGVEFVFEVSKVPSDGDGLSGSGGSEPVWTNISSLTDSDLPLVDNEIEWNAVAIYSSSFLNTNRKIRVGISLGNGILLLQPGAVAGATSIDDHDESSFAHIDIQDALNRHGIYVSNITQGKTTFTYRGQSVDEKATFTGVTDGQQVLVFKDAATGDYKKAIQNDGAEENVVGMSRNVVSNKGNVIEHGFISANTIGLSIGDPLYLSSISAGAFTTTATTIRIGTVCLIGTDTGDETGGMIVLDIRFLETVAVDLLIKGTTGLTGYDVIVGSVSEVSSGLATHTIDDWITGTGALENGDRVYIRSNVVMSINQDVTFDDLKIYFDPLSGIDAGSANTLTFSGNRIEIFKGQFTGFSTNDLIISGNAINISCVEGDLDWFNVTGISSIVKSTDALSGSISGFKTSTWNIDTRSGDATFSGDLSGVKGTFTGTTSLQGNLLENKTVLNNPSGGLYVVKSTDITIVNNSTINVTINLPDAVTSSERILNIINNSVANITTITAESGDTIEGNSTLVLSSQFQSVILTPDSTEWFTI